MQPGGKFPDDQAWVQIGDLALEALDEMTEADKIDVLAEIMLLCEQPAGKHTLSKSLRGLNTLDVLQGEQRVIFESKVVDGVGELRVLLIGERKGDRVYDIATNLLESGRLTEEEEQSIWEALALLSVVEEQVGLDGWDYAPPVAPEGMIKATVASGLLSEDVARGLSIEEIQAAQASGWGPSGPDPEKALEAAMAKARPRAKKPASLTEILKIRKKPRCSAMTARTHEPCIRRAGHPGPHRAR